MWTFIFGLGNGLALVRCQAITRPSETNFSEMKIEIHIQMSFRHYDDVITGTVASQITSLTIVYSTVWSDADKRKHQSSALLAFVWGIHWWLVNSPHKWPVKRKIFPFHDVIMARLVQASMCYKGPCNEHIRYLGSNVLELNLGHSWITISHIVLCVWYDMELIIYAI